MIIEIVMSDFFVGTEEEDEKPVPIWGGTHSPSASSSQSEGFTACGSGIVVGASSSQLAIENVSHLDTLTMCHISNQASEHRGRQ